MSNRYYRYFSSVLVSSIVVFVTTLLFFSWSEGNSPFGGLRAEPTGPDESTPVSSSTFRTTDVVHALTTDMVWMVLVVAFLSALVVDLQKDVTPMRASFHHDQLRRWIKSRLSSKARELLHELEKCRNSNSATRDSDCPDDAKARIQMERLVGLDQREDEFSGDTVSHGFYGLTTEQLCTQLATAMEFAVLTPAAYPEFFVTMAGGASSEYRDVLRTYLSPDVTPEVNIAEMINSIHPPTDGEDASSAGHVRSTGDRDAQIAVTRARILNHAQRVLDNLQYALHRKWRITLLRNSLVASYVASVLIWLVARPFSTSSSAVTGRTVIGVFLTTIAGALLAPLPHDLVRRIRGRQT